MRLGSDPEVFLVDNTGKHISAIGYINADKHNPLQIADMEAGFTLQEDNVSLEYGIPPAASSKEFQSHLRRVMAKSLDWLPGLSFSNLSCIAFDEDQLEHPRARIFGCEPDYNAWTLDVNPKPAAANPALRSAGGHIHVETDLDAAAVIRAMDLFLGVPSVLMDTRGAPRRELYGKAGAFRKKSYGVEYRTLSNFWVLDEKLIDWVWRNTERALANVGGAEYFEKDILGSINNGDIEAAKFLVKSCKLEVL